MYVCIYIYIYIYTLYTIYRQRKEASRPPPRAAHAANVLGGSQPPPQPRT